MCWLKIYQALKIKKQASLKHCIATILAKTELAQTILCKRFLNGSVNCVESICTTLSFMTDSIVFHVCIATHSLRRFMLFILAFFPVVHDCIMLASLFLVESIYFQGKYIFPSAQKSIENKAFKNWKTSNTF